MQNNIDTLILVIGTVLDWLKQDAVIPFIPAGVLGLCGFATLMLETYKAPTPPIWTWTVGFFISWGWMFYTFPANEVLLEKDGYWAERIGDIILTGMLSFAEPFIIGLIPAVFWMVGVLAVEFVKDPEVFLGRH